MKILLNQFFHFSYVFWFGDLNFRLENEAWSPSDIKRMVEEDRIEELVAQDQLSLVRKQGRAFKELEERTPAFPPTFKFEQGTSEYDLKYILFNFFLCLNGILK